MKDACDNIAELLVDYADGLLGAEEAAKVADHLSECENCRMLVGSLNRSLELAQVIWEDNFDRRPETIRMPGAARAVQRSWLKYAAAAIIVISVVFLTVNRIEEPLIDEPTFAEMERRIAEAGSAARLLAAADLLGGYSDTEPIAKQQYRRIAETYPQTAAAAKAKSQIE